MVIAHMGQAVLDGRVDVLGYDPRRGASVCSLATPRPRPSRVGFGYAYPECHVAMFGLECDEETRMKRFKALAAIRVDGARTAAAGTRSPDAPLALAPVRLPTVAVSRLSTLNPPLPLTAASALPTRVSSLTRRSTPRRSPTPPRSASPSAVL